MSGFGYNDRAIPGDRGSGNWEITAAFRSRCLVCDEMIEEGDPIRMDSGDKEWIHAKCDEAEES